jgi:tRNA U34 5-methylaminomethyl-2-thiouridine-forming methyltransferase MnmC
MKKKIIFTKDGSHSIFLKEINETYHSIHGSISESNHVFIQNGLKNNLKKHLKILEIGFGTGLNALLTLINADKKNIKYTSIEPFPLEEAIYNKLNFHELLNINKDIFLQLHYCNWETDIHISDNFTLHKTKCTLENYKCNEQNDIIFFDAFAPEKQSEMWKKSILKKCFKLISHGGYLVTYCAKGVVKRTLKEIGFDVESLPGPPGKREMIRAKKRKL